APRWSRGDRAAARGGPRQVARSDGAGDRQRRARAPHALRGRQGGRAQRARPRGAHVNGGPHRDGRGTPVGEGTFSRMEVTSRWKSRGRRGTKAGEGP